MYGALTLSHSLGLAVIACALLFLVLTLCSVARDAFADWRETRRMEKARAARRVIAGGRR